MVVVQPEDMEAFLQEKANHIRTQKSRGLESTSAEDLMQKDISSIPLRRG